MKKKLMFLDRMILMSVLPEKGTFVTLKIIRKLREALSPSAAEVKKLAVKENPNGSVNWNPEKDNGITVEIDDLALDLIKKSLKELDSKGDLTNDHLTIYEMFI